MVYDNDDTIIQSARGATSRHYTTESVSLSPPSGTERHNLAAQGALLLLGCFVFLRENRVVIGYEWTPKMQR